ncbi:stalk domain-containing protein [Cohnella soli]|uniref:Stalk domain-containing protein n=1 Tax=Cohnella soli TaxID=425005 RepID=A0ABW0HYW7_9BACL
MRGFTRKCTLLIAGIAIFASIPNLATAAPNVDWTQSAKLYEVHTWAGKSDLGHTDGKTSEATFFHPHSVVVMPNGQLLISDSSNQLLRKVSASEVSAYAGQIVGVDESNLPTGGYNDDELAHAAFEQPLGLAVDAQGNVYVADSKNNAIRKVSKDGKVTTLAGNGLIGASDGVGQKATFFEPSDVAVDAAGKVYVADTLNNVIRKISPDGTVTTLTAPSTRIVEYHPGAVDYVGDFADGAIASAKFNEPSALAIDNKGNLYVSDRGNCRIRYIDFNANKVTTVAGSGELAKDAIYVEGGFVDGDAQQSRFASPEGLTIAADGTLIVADSLNHVIRSIKNGKVSTVAGITKDPGSIDGVAGSAQFNHPTDVAVLSDGRLVIVDEQGNKVRVLQSYTKPTDLPTDKGIQTLLRGKRVVSDVPAQMKSNSVLLPVNAVGTALGYTVDYDPKSKSAILTKGELTYVIGPNTKTVTKTLKGKSEQLTLNAPSLIVNNRMFIPVRFFATEENLDIQWDSAAQIVVIRDRTF